MLILALETATRAGSLALVKDRAAGPAVLGDASRTHGIRLPDEVTGFLASAGLELADVECFAVVTGPGSFTGLRIGLATIQGFALAGHRPVIGIPTLDAMASGWLEDPARPSTLARTLLVTTLDGARGDVFYAVYDVTAAASLADAGVVIGPSVAEPSVAAAAVAAVRHGAVIVLTGNLPERHLQAFVAALDALEMAPMPNLAAATALLAARGDASATAPHALRPVYVRRPDAELARERAARDRRRTEPVLAVVAVTAPDDVARVAELQARAFGDAWGEEALSGGLANSNVARLYAARDGDGRFVAYCAGWRVVDELHINSLAVEPSQRRQGIARHLLRQVMAMEARSGAAAATLEVRESNRAGRALYESLGFRVEGVRRGYYQHPREDALVLWHRHLSTDG